MGEYGDDGLATRLRTIIDGRSLSIREVAKAIDVPYRTLQNQLLGHNKMPASTFARLLAFLELPAEFVTEGRYQPRHRPIANALKRAFGDHLPAVDPEMRIVAPPAESRTAEQLDQHAQALAFLFREAYEWEVAELSDIEAASTWGKGSQ